jgi:hypothetical protein
MTTNIMSLIATHGAHAVVIRRFSLNEASLGLFKFISDYLPYFEKNKLFWVKL